MENYKAKLLGGTALVALGAGLLGMPAAPARAQASLPGGAVQTQETGQNARAATGVAANTRTSCTTTQDSVANLTLTMTPNAGNFVYVLGFYDTVIPNGTGAVSTVAWSTSNMPGSLAWMSGEVTATPGNPTVVSNIAESYPGGIKSLVAGTAVTVTPSATMASATQCVRVLWYQAPG